jgi:chorismate mutase
MIRGLRGAITVEANMASEILEATEALLSAMVEQNKIALADIASVLFTVTSDLNAEFPAAAARKMGWKNVPLLCATEIPVQGSLPLAIRVLMHVNTAKTQEQIQHIYLKGAKVLRDDL